MFDPNTLYASLFWSSVGSGLLFYGKKRVSAPAISAGLALIAINFLVTSPPALCITGAALLAGSITAIRMGY